MIEKQRELVNAVVPKTERLYQKYNEEENNSSSRLPNIRTSRDQQQNSESNRTGQR